MAKGTVYAVGIGPGAPEYLTRQAEEAIRRSSLLCGYTVYVGLIAPLFPDKEILTTPMKKEEERCRLALEAASSGRDTAMVCSGDAGVYGMAGLLLELLPQYPDAEVEVVPGVTAALSGAAVLGAPLANDFCVVSLSDLLTPWSVIEKRLRAAVIGDFAVCLYNPGSHRRTEHLRRACEVMAEAGLSEDTVCGRVRNIGREGQEKEILTFGELKELVPDMFTTVFIGNSETRAVGGRLVTPRGYPSAGGGR